MVLIANGIGQVIREDGRLVRPGKNLQSEGILRIIPIDQIQVVTRDPKWENDWLGYLSNAGLDWIDASLGQVGRKLFDGADARSQSRGEGTSHGLRTLAVPRRDLGNGHR